MPPEFRFCRVCRRNQDHGRKHVYTKSHQKSLVLVLQKIQAKIKDVKFFVKNPVVMMASDRSSHSHWCFFCNKEILETESKFACENTIHHLAGADHMEMLHGFFEENGADKEKMRSFQVSKDDLQKWERQIKLEARGPVLPALPHHLPSQQASASSLPADRDVLFAGEEDLARSHGPDRSGSKQASPYSQEHSLLRNIQPTNKSQPCRPRDFPPTSGQQPYSSRDIQPTNSGAALAFPSGTVGNVGECAAAASSFLLETGSGPLTPFSTFKEPFPSQLGTWDSHRGRKSIGNATWECHMGREASSISEAVQSSSGAVPLGRPAGTNSETAAERVTPQAKKESGDLRVPGASSRPQTFGDTGMQAAAAGGSQALGAPPPWLLPSQTAGPSEAAPPLGGLSATIVGKKLNPKRVGAAWSDRRRLELELERAGKRAPEPIDPSWMPNFGGVWEIGRRKGQDGSHKRRRAKES